MRIGVSGQNDEVDRRLRSHELDDLIEEGSARLFSAGRGGVHVEVNLERDHTLPAVVRDPQSLDPRVVVGMPEHVWVFAVSVDELHRRKHIPAHAVEQLEHGTILTANDDATIYEGERRGHVISTNLVRPEWQLGVADVPHSQCGVIGNGSYCRPRDVEVEGDDRLR